MPDWWWGSKSGVGVDVGAGDQDGWTDPYSVLVLRLNLFKVILTREAPPLELPVANDLPDRPRAVVVATLSAESRGRVCFCGLNWLPSGKGALSQSG